MGYYSTKECIDIIYEYDDLITKLSNQYRIPKAAIQSVLLRELRCYDVRDDGADALVAQQFIYLYLLDQYNNSPWWQQIFMEMPSPPIPYVEDSSTGDGAAGYGNAVYKCYVIFDKYNKRDLK